MSSPYRPRSLKLLLGLAAILAWAHGAHAALPAYPASQQEYWANFERRDWSAAITSAEKLVNAARAAPGNAQQLADALALLGSAQLGSKNLVAAEAAYTEALQIIEPRVGPSSEKLLEPLRGLGYTLAAAGKHERAIPLLQKALVVSRRNFGLFDVNQQGLLRQLASSLTSVDEAAAAERHILYLLRIGERTYGPGDARMSPLLCTVGDWYTQIGIMAPARESYRAALSITEQKIGKASVAAIVPLRALASSYRRELYLAGSGLLRPVEHEQAAPDTASREMRPITAQFLNAEGERALLRAVKILEATPDPPTDLMIDTLVDTGDWYQIRSQPQKAFPFYRRAVALVAPLASAGTTAAGSPFAFPVQVYLPTPLLATRNRFRPDTQIEERFVQVEFTVTRDGLVKDERVVDEDATSRQVAETLDAIRSARYRPRFVDGEPVDTAAVSYRQIFRQRKDS